MRTTTRDGRSGGEGVRGWSRTVRSLAAGAAAVGITALAACASGAKPETGELSPTEYYALFDGEWVLDREASADPAVVLDRRRLSGERPEGAGRPPGGRRPGGFPGGDRTGPSVDPGALQATLELARERPVAFDLSVTDTTVTTTLAGAVPHAIPVAGDAATFSRDGQEVELRAEWDGRRLAIRRHVRDGGIVEDLLEPVADGSRLVVTRELRGLPGGSVELLFAYDRAGP